MRSRRFGKRDVEALLRAVERAGDDPDAVRRALVEAGVPPEHLDRDLDGLFAVVATLNETRRMPMDPALAATARAWLEDDPDPETRAELSRLLDDNDEDAVAERFRTRLGFGTAGIRGPLGAGPNRINLAVVLGTVAGFARWLPESACERGVVVARDGRHRSNDFAREAARMLSGAGIPAHLLDGPVPTPLLAFAVRHLDAAGGLMITASHNPPNDNGVKVYDATGAQIAPPSDTEISTRIGEISRVRELPRDDGLVRHLGSEVLDAYLDATRSLVADGPRDVRVVHTAMHGVGWEPLRRLFEAAGFPEPMAVAEQAVPDPAFPTLVFPNPEEPGALDRALALADRERADVVLANDPDADRLGVAVPDADGWRQLTGDEIGVLLGDHVLAMTSGEDRLVACSIVSSSMLERIAAAAGVRFASTLTGFKWIVRGVDQHPGSRFVYGYEEALGYAVGDIVRDKDGLTAALAFADLVARLKADGLTVHKRLEDLARRHGLHATRQWSIRRTGADGAQAIAAAVRRTVDAPPAAIAGHAVRSIERPAADVVVLWLDGDARVIVRPSGTEPKLKTYLQVVVHDIRPGRDGWRAARTAADASIEELRRGLLDHLGLGE